MTTPSKKSNVAYDLLLEAHPHDFVATYYRDKIAQRPLYLKPTPKDNDDELPNARALRQKSRAEAKIQKRKSPGKPKPLSAKQKRALQIFEIPPEQRKYAIYVPLHRLWCGYIRDVLGLERKEDTTGGSSGYGSFVDAKSAGPLLASADFHGALLEVVQCRCVGRVGTKGIVVRDTKLTFEIITAKNVLKVIPKEHTIFRFEVPLNQLDQESSETQSAEMGKPFQFELHGSNFEFRAPERATRSMKVRELKPSEING